MFICFTGVIHVFLHIDLNTAYRINKCHETCKVCVDIMLDGNTEQITYGLFGQLRTPVGKGCIKSAFAMPGNGDIGISQYGE